MRAADLGALPDRRGDDVAALRGRWRSATATTRRSRRSSCCSPGSSRSRASTSSCRLLPRKIVYPLLGMVAALLLAAAIGTGDYRSPAGSPRACSAGWFARLLRDQPHRRRRLLGFGDVRLALVLGLGLGWLGVAAVLVGFFAANLLGAVVGLTLIAAKKMQRDQPIPYGVFLALGAALAIYVAPDDPPAPAGRVVARASTRGSREPDGRAIRRAVSALMAPADDVDARLERPRGRRSSPRVFDGCEVGLIDARGLDVGTVARHRDAAPRVGGPRDSRRCAARVLERRGRPEVCGPRRVTARRACVVACIRTATTPSGTIACISQGRALDDADEARRGRSRTSVGSWARRSAASCCSGGPATRHAAPSGSRASSTSSSPRRSRWRACSARPTSSRRSRRGRGASSMPTRPSSTLDTGPGPRCRSWRDGRRRRARGPSDAAVAVPAAARSSTVDGARRGLARRTAARASRRDEGRRLRPPAAPRRRSATTTSRSPRCSPRWRRRRSTPTEMHRTILRSEERLRVLVDTAPIGIVETDLDGRDRVVEPGRRRPVRVAGRRHRARVAGSPRSRRPRSLAAPRRCWARRRRRRRCRAHDLSGVELARPATGARRVRGAGLARPRDDAAASSRWSRT